MVLLAKHNHIHSRKVGVTGPSPDCGKWSGETQQRMLRGGGGQGHETGDFSPLTVEGVGVHPREFFI